MTTRRTLLTAAALAALATPVLLGGCGGDGPAAGDGPVIRHAMGTTQVWRKTQRVVVLDTPELETVTALGITPVGMTLPDAVPTPPAHLRARLASTQLVGVTAEPNIEKIAALRPDLILSNKKRHTRIYDRLARIAPTVFTPDPSTPWKDNFRLYARALGQEAKADTLLAEYHARAKRVGAAIAAANGGTPPTVSVVRFVDGPTRLYQRRSFSGTVLADAGLRRPASQDVDKFTATVGPEKADQADADYVFVSTYGDPDKTRRSAFEASPIWKTLGAARNGRVFQVQDEAWMLSIGVQGAHLVLDDLAKAAKVDPLR